jgi:hypothetical protein
VSTRMSGNPPRTKSGNSIKTARNVMDIVRKEVEP